MNCQICGAPARAAFALRPENDLGKQYVPQQYLDTPRQVIECTSCGLGTYAPRLEAEHVAAFYSDDYFTFRLDPDAAAAANLTAGRAAAELLHSELDSLNIPTFGPHLDVGCAFGGLLRNSRARQLYGIEVGAVAADWLRTNTNIAVSTDPLTSQSFPGIRFGLITMLDVIEHLERPADTIAAAYAKLDHGGALVVTTPDFRGVRRKLRGPRWRMFQLEHLWYFTGSALTLIARQAGFQPVRLLHSNRMTAGLVEPGEFFHDLPPTLRWMNVRGVRRATLTAMRAAGVSDDLKLVAVKP